LDDILAHLLNALPGVLLSSWDILLDSGAYVIFGLAVAGLVNAFVGSQTIAERLGSRSLKSVITSSLVGVPLPLCSCGVVPTAVSLYQRGASKGSAVSFLVSTPETGVDSIAISYALLDPLMTVFRPVAAFLTAIFAGSLENLFDKKDAREKETLQMECLVCGGDEGMERHEHSIPSRIVGGMRYAFVELLHDISKWFLLGIVVAGAIGYFVPENLITERAGYGWPAMFFMALAGIPLYMCATSSTPIASALVAKGVSPGAALVFLLTGPATNAASFLVVAKFLGIRATAVYLCSILVSSLLLGWVLNRVYLTLGVNATAIVGRGSEVFPVWFKAAAGIGLLLLIVNCILQKRKEKTCCHESGKENHDAYHFKS
jgi:uncharacterized membrane protein YraQ (UPF0718 family)